MRITFKYNWLDELAFNPAGQTKFSPAIVRSYRLLVTRMIAAVDERELRAMKSSHFEQLQGKRKGEYSMRLNDQFRLIFTITPGTPKNIIHITNIEDYH
jgi:proteic killer suppression protein